MDLVFGGRLMPHLLVGMPHKHTSLMQIQNEDAKEAKETQARDGSGSVRVSQRARDRCCVRCGREMTGIQGMRGIRGMNMINMNRITWMMHHGQGRNMAMVHSSTSSSDDTARTTQSSMCSMCISDEDIKRVFDRMDEDGSGVIEMEELRHALGRLRLPTSDEYIQELTLENHFYANDSTDSDTPKRLTLDAFTKYVRENERAIRKIFQSLDIDKDNHLTASELARALSGIGVHASHDDATEMIRLLDSSQSKNGQIELVEFLEFVCLLPKSQMKYNSIFNWFDSAVLSNPIKYYERGSERIAPNYDSFKVVIAGGIAGVISKSLMAPIERIRSIVMVQQSTSATSTIAVRTATSKTIRLMPSLLRQSLSPLGLAKKIVRDEGVAGLYRGNVATIMSIFPKQGIEFAMFERMKRKFRSENHGELTALQTLICGAIAGFVSQTVVHPLDVAYSLQSVGQAKGNLGQVLFTIMRERGIRGLYAGYRTKMLEDVIGSAIGLGLYEFGQNCYQDIHGYHPKPKEKAIIGAISALVTLSITFPISVIARVAMCRSTPGVPVYKGFMHAFNDLTSSGGIRNLFKGIGLSYCRVIPAYGMVYFMYESMNQLLAVGGIHKFRTTAMITHRGYLRDEEYADNACPQNPREIINLF